MDKHNFTSLKDKSEYFDAYKLNEIFNEILESKQHDEMTHHRFLSAVGNDHAGTYYSAIKNVLPAMLEHIKTSDNHIFIKTAFALLTDLFYFEADGESFSSEAERLECQNHVRATIFELSKSYQPFKDYLKSIGEN